MSDKLFSNLNVSNKVSRNGFDIGNRVNFTAKAGELLPIWHRDMIFGDRIRLNINHFTRTAPVDTAAATQIREYFDVFFVPYRILWKNAPQVHTQNKENPITATSPFGNLQIGQSTPNFDFYNYLGLSTSTFLPNNKGIISYLLGKRNSMGYSRGFMSAKLLNHLGYSYLSIANLKYLAGDSSASSDDAPRYGGPQYLSLYPLLAYQCLFYNFYRNSSWEDNQPYNYNVDYLGQDAFVDFPSPQASAPTGQWLQYWDNPTLFDLHYSNYPRDLFFGLLPDSQQGDVADVDLDGSLDISKLGGASVTVPRQSVDVPSSTVGPYYDSSVHSATAHIPAGSSGVSLSVSSSPSASVYNAPLRTFNGTGTFYGGTYPVDGLNFQTSFESSFNVLQLRKAQFLQKYREIRGSGQNDYKNLVRKLFDVEVPDDLANIPLYLGGGSSTIKISEVENTNLASGNQATIAGNGRGSSNTGDIEFECKEPGLIMVIYHAQPVIDYALNALHFDVVRTEADDFANPVFDRLGFQEMPAYYLYTDQLVADGGSFGSPSDSPAFDILGYTSRYFDYKTGVDMTLGDFRETSTSWLSPLNFDYLKHFLQTTDDQYKFSYFDINANFFRCDPSILDPIFSLKAGFTDEQNENWYSDMPQNTVATDQLRVFCTVNCSAIRPLDRNGLPY